MQQYETISQLNSERYARLERAQVLVNQFWETYEELNPWIEETQALISQLPPPAIDHEQLKQQQEDMRVRGRGVGVSRTIGSSALNRGAALAGARAPFFFIFSDFFPHFLLSGDAIQACRERTVWKSLVRLEHFLLKHRLHPREPGCLRISCLIVAGRTTLCF